MMLAQDMHRDDRMCLSATTASRSCLPFDTATDRRGKGKFKKINGQSLLKELAHGSYQAGKLTAHQVVGMTCSGS